MRLAPYLSLKLRFLIDARSPAASFPLVITPVLTPPLDATPWLGSAGSPAPRRGEWYIAPLHASPDRPRTTGLLLQFLELRRVPESGCSLPACRRRTWCLAYEPPVVWAHPDAARWRGAGRAYSSPGNRVAQWRDHSRAIPAGRARAAARYTSRRARCRAWQRPVDLRGNSLLSSARRAAWVQPHYWGQFAAPRDTTPSAPGHDQAHPRCRTARPSPDYRSGARFRHCRRPTKAAGAAAV